VAHAGGRSPGVLAHIVTANNSAPGPKQCYSTDLFVSKQLQPHTKAFWRSDRFALAGAQAG
jgi:hypothetical protein